MRPYCQDGLKVYRDADIKSKQFQDGLRLAVIKWRRLCSEYVSKHGDKGSCVCGCGIFINYLGPRKRKPQPLCIIDPLGTVTGFQGSVIWESSQKDIVQTLMDCGVECWFEYGHMD